MSKQNIKKANTIKLFGKSIIIRGELEESSIVLSEEDKKSVRVKEVKVFLIGNEVEKVVIGDEVRVKGTVLHDITRPINPFEYNGSDYKTEDEFYLLVNEDEIIGKF